MRLPLAVAASLLLVAICAHAQTLETIAGNGQSSVCSVVDGPATQVALAAPTRIAFDSANRLYFIDICNNIRVLDAGNVRTLPITGLTGAPLGLAVDSHNVLYIATGTTFPCCFQNVTAQSGVFRVDSATNVATKIVTVYSASGLVVDANGKLLTLDISGGAVVRIDPADGTTVNIACDCNFAGPTRNFGPLPRFSLIPGTLAIDAAGNIYATSPGVANPGLKKIDATTQAVTTYAGGGSGVGVPATSGGVAPTQVAVDPAGNVFLSDGNLLLVDAASRTLSQLTASFSVQSGAIRIPASALAVAPNGGIYLANGGVIQRYTPPNPLDIFSLTAASIAFGDTAVSSPRTVPFVVRNQTQHPLDLLSASIASFSAGTPFSFINNCPLPPQELAAMQSCNANLRFAPLDATLPFGGSSTLSSSGVAIFAARGTTATVQLSGRAVSDGELSITPAQLEFGNATPTATPDPAHVQTVFITNTGTGAVKFRTLGVYPGNTASGPLDQNFSALFSSCPPYDQEGLAPGATCIASVAFTPTRIGRITSTLFVVDDAAGNPHRVPLGGTGDGPLGQFPFNALSTSFFFRTVAIGFPPPPAQSFTINSVGTQPLRILGLTGLHQFSAATNCAGDIAPGTSCTVTVGVANFTEPQFVSETLQILTNAVPLRIDVAANAALLLVSPSRLDFGNVPVGTSSPAQSVTMQSAPFGPPFTLHSCAVTGPFQVQTPCSGTVFNNGAALAISALFSPTTAGPASGTLTLNGTFDGQPPDLTLVLPLTGNTPGGGIAVSGGPLLFPQTAVGTASAALPLTFTNLGSAPLALSSIAASQDFLQSNDCGPSLAPLAQCAISMTFVPTAVGTRNGNVVINVAGQAPYSVPLNGRGVFAGLSVSAVDFDFGQQPQFTASAPRTLIVTNRANSTITVPDFTFSYPTVVGSGSFESHSSCLPATLSPGASCSADIVFFPRAAIPIVGSLQFRSSELIDYSVRLRGTGASSGGLVLSTGDLFFAPQAIGTTSAPQPIVMTNSSDVARRVLSVDIDGDFLRTEDCVATPVAPHGHCTINVMFRPQFAGQRFANINILVERAGTDGEVLYAEAQGSTIEGPLSVSPLTLAFDHLPVGVSSTPQDVTVRNLSPGNIRISSITSSGTEFAATHNCPATLLATTSCIVTVVFTPSAPGTRNGQLTVSTLSNGAVQVPLTGAGSAVSPLVQSASALNFLPQIVGATSSSLALTLENRYGFSIALASITAAGDYAQTNNCGTALASGASCTVNVTFTPTAIGQRNALLTIVHSAFDSPRNVPLNGSGVDVVVAPAPGSSSAATIASGQTANFSLSIAPVGTISGVANLTCAGAPPSGSCALAPATVNIAPGVPATATLSVSTRVRGANTTIGQSSFAPPTSGGATTGSRAAMAVLIALLLSLRRLRTRIRPALSLALLALCGFVGCGGGGSATPPTPSPGTPAGAYTVVVTATITPTGGAASVTRTMNFSVTVQ
jgi:hypothetical protein